MNALKDKKIKIPIKDKGLLKNILVAFGYFALGFVLSLGAVINNSKPFGIAFVSVSGKKHFAFSAVGAILGYIIGGINQYSVRYLIAVVIAVIGAFLADVLNLKHNIYFPMAVSGFADLVTGLVLNFENESAINNYVVLIGECILAVGGAFFFYKSIHCSYKRIRFKALPLSEMVCIIISASIVMMNLSSLYIGIVCPARIVATIIVLIATVYGGDRWGVALALSLGFALSIAQDGNLFILGAFAFSALIGVLFYDLNIFAISGAYWLTICFFCAAGYENAISLSIFIESSIGTLIFVLLPSKICDKLQSIWDEGTNPPTDESLRQNLVLKLRFASSAMATISDCVDQVREKINDYTRKENDKKRDYISEEEYIRNEIILEKTNQIRMVASDQFFSISGMLEDLAFEFDEAEIFNSNASAKIRQLLGDYEIYPTNISVIENKFGRIRVEILIQGNSKNLSEKSLQEEIGKICNRYFDSGKITNFKNETMLSFFEKPNYRLKVCFAQHSAEGNFCGDTVKIINDNNGHTILIISDGMGKGSRAALDGAMGAGLLSKLINAGFGFDSALKVVNSALLVKSNDESLATLDIANIDLFTGKCEIFKAGAPASYIIKNDTINKCELTSMPAGILRGIEFAKRTAVLSLDDSIILMSDGITDLGDDYLSNTFSHIDEIEINKRADYILTTALESSEGQKIDDMSVIYAKLERN